MDDRDFSLFAAPPPKKPSTLLLRTKKIFGQFVFLILLLLAAGGGALAGLVFVYSSDLPRVQQLEDYRPDVMTELYADDGAPIGSFALERRVIVNYDQIPPVLRDAIISIEDRHFESHWGVDIVGIARSAITDLMEWKKTQGASTLTMQLSRRLFLTLQKSWIRKVQEALLAIQIERRFTKAQIFSMYVNLIPLGHGNFGFEAASQFYFGKHLKQLSLPEAALLAGLPRSPTAYSPLLHPETARDRRDVVLRTMLDNHKINEEQYRDAKAAPLGLSIQRWTNSTAPYFVEDVRQFLESKYGTETVQAKGLRVYTTLNVHMQKVATEALRQGLRDDDKRRGWRGAEDNILVKPRQLANGHAATLETYTHPDWPAPLEAGKLVHGLVMEVNSQYAAVRFGEATARVTRPDFAWTGRTDPRQLFTQGDVDLFQIKNAPPAGETHSGRETVEATLDQQPTEQGALVCIDNATGAIKAMVGGYDFDVSKFNRARQAERQTGSSFKIYVYAEALLEGADPFGTISDSPISFPTSSGIWAPHNYDEKFEGEITLLHALAESRNVPAVRLLARVGVDKVIKLCRKFGITSRLVPNLPLALGASDLTLLEHTSAFTAFPDDGVRIEPRMVTRVTNYDGRVIDDFVPHVTDVLPAPVARLETSMLREVFNSGTAVRAKALAQKYPLAGKTGTTNDFGDAWFIGFSPDITCGVWVGFDDHRSLGPKEEGAKVALPIWMDFMGKVLDQLPTKTFPDSPLLTSPEQVKEILASGGSERLLVSQPGVGENPSPPPEASPPQAVLPGGGTLPAAPGNQKSGTGASPPKPSSPAPDTKPASPGAPKPAAGSPTTSTSNGDEARKSSPAHR
jgi:penicillin-binding protein 1A